MLSCNVLEEQGEQCDVEEGGALLCCQLLEQVDEEGPVISVCLVFSRISMVSDRT